MEDEKFRQDLDELFRLFKKLMQDRSLEDMPGVNKAMIQQFEFFFNNYENMKDQIAYQLQGQFGESVKQMVRTLIDQLREELGEEGTRIEIDDDPEPEDSTVKITGLTVEEKLKAIDEKLRDPNLTEDQINDLLDQRAMYQ